LMGTGIVQDPPQIPPRARTAPPSTAALLRYRVLNVLRARQVNSRGVTIVDSRTAKPPVKYPLARISAKGAGVADAKELRSETRTPPPVLRAPATYETVFLTACAPK
jgi:hypothetical protein